MVPGDACFLLARNELRESGTGTINERSEFSVIVESRVHFQKKWSLDSVPWDHFILWLKEGTYSPREYRCRLSQNPLCTRGQILPAVFWNNPEEA